MRGQAGHRTARAGQNEHPARSHSVGQPQHGNCLLLTQYLAHLRELSEPPVMCSGHVEQRHLKGGIDTRLPGADWRHDHIVHADFCASGSPRGSARA